MINSILVHRPARFFRKASLAVATLAGAVAVGGFSHAQDDVSANSGTLTIELNAMQATQNGCLFTFVAENGLEAEIARAAYEVVFFDGQGLVQRMTVLDFQTLPEGRMRVRQFNIADADCDDVSQVLINDVSACEGDGIEPSLCMDRLETTTQSKIRFSH